MTELLNRFTATPEQTANDRTNRLESITKWNGLLEKYRGDYYKDPRRILPTDLEEMKMFLRDRLSILRKSTTLSTTALDGLNNNLETQKFEALQENYQARAELSTFLDDLEAELEKGPATAEKVLALKACLTKSRIWMMSPANKYLSSEDYDAHMEELLEAGSQLLDKRALNVGNVREWLKTVEADEQMKQDTFDVGDMFKKMFTTAAGLVGVFLLILFGLLGASLAMNMNLYRNVGFRILYFLYGFVFFPFPIVRMLFLWFMQSRRPEFFAILPFVEGEKSGWFTFVPLTPEKKTELRVLENP